MAQLSERGLSAAVGGAAAGSARLSGVLCPPEVNGRRLARTVRVDSLRRELIVSNDGRHRSRLAGHCPLWQPARKDVGAAGASRRLGVVVRGLDLDSVEDWLRQEKVWWRTDDRTDHLLRADAAGSCASTSTRAPASSRVTATGTELRAAAKFAMSARPDGRAESTRDATPGPPFDPVHGICTGERAGRSPVRGTVDVNAVVVPVTVRNKAGRVVTGVSRETFHLRSTASRSRSAISISKAISRSALALSSIPRVR